MIRIAAVMVVLTATVLAAHGQDLRSMDYDYMDINEAGAVVSTRPPYPNKITGGVSITLRAEDASVKPLNLASAEAELEYSDPETLRPDVIVLKGSSSRQVVVEHPQGTITADRADCNFRTKKIVFTGNVSAKMEKMPPMKTDRIEFDMDSGAWSAEGSVTVQGISLGGASRADGGAAMWLLREADVRSWEGLIEKLKSQGAADAPSPGKRILALLDPEARKTLETVDTSTLLQNKADLLKAVNGVLKESAFYDKEAWAGIPLDGEAQPLAAEMERGNLPASEIPRLNRRLLEAAYPREIVKRPPADEGNAS